jgi:hypothetical protein
MGCCPLVATCSNAARSIGAYPYIECVFENDLVELDAHGGWQARQPEPGTWLWRSPHRRIYLVNATSTHPLGNTEFAQSIWRAASPPDEPASWPELTDCRFGFSLGPADGEPLRLPTA